MYLWFNNYPIMVVSHIKKINRLFSLQLMILLLLADVIIDPGNLIFHAKYILFALVFLFWIPEVLHKKPEIPVKLWWAVFFVSVFMPFYALSISILNHSLQNTPPGTFVYFNSFFFFAVILVIVSEKTDLTTYFNYTSLLIVIITLGLYFLLLLNPGNFGKLYHYFVEEKQTTVYALRDYGKVTLLMIFYKTSPLLVFPLSYYLYMLFIRNRKIRISVVMVFFLSVTLFLSGTRANLLSMIIIWFFYFGFFLFRKSKISFLWIVAGFTVILFFILPPLAEGLFNRNEASNVIKFGYLSSYSNFFNHHWISLLLGQGVGGSFYAAGLDRWIDVSELTYLELIRVWGLPVGLSFIVFLFLPLIKEIRNKNISHLFIAYLAYLFISGTNPLLMSSTGMLVLVYVFSKVFFIKDKMIFHNAKHQEQ